MTELIRFQNRKAGTSTAVYVMSVLAAAALTFGLVIFFGNQWVASSPPAAVLDVTSTLSICNGPIRTNCVVDGDTFWLQSVKIRIADIDTPEIGEPKCEAELALGKRATQRMRELLNAGPFELEAWPDRDEDQYGRKLRVVVRGGQSLGNVLVSEGLARTWTGRREPWC